MSSSVRAAIARASRDGVGGRGRGARKDANGRRASAAPAFVYSILVVVLAAHVAPGCASRGAPREPAPEADTKSAIEATVAQIVGSSSLVGKVVRIEGLCSGYPPGAVAGPPPLTRSDWVLADDGAAIYVTGEPPPGCEPTASTETHVEILATVLEDSIDTLGGAGRRTPRRYLVIIPE